MSRHRARRHERVRAHVRPGAVEARVRPQLDPGATCCRRTSRTRTRVHKWWFGTSRRPREQLRDHRGRREAVDDGPPARRARSSRPRRSRDGIVRTSRRRSRPARAPSARSSPTATTASGTATTAAVSTTPASSTGTRTRTAPTRPAPSATACTGWSTAASATCPGSGRPTPIKLFDPAGHGHDLRREQRPARADTARRSRCPANAPAARAVARRTRQPRRGGRSTQPSPATYRRTTRAGTPATTE